MRFVILALILAAAAGCTAADTAKATKMAGDAVAKAKEAFLNPITAKFEEISKKIGELSGEQQKEAQALFDKSKINEIKDSPADKWEGLKASVEDLFKKLKEMLKL